MGTLFSRNRRTPVLPPTGAGQNETNQQTFGTPRGTRDPADSLRPEGAEGGGGGPGSPRGSGLPDTVQVEESRLQAVLKGFRGYRTRALAFATVGILLNAYGATHGRKEWVIRYDGSFYQAAAAKLLKPVVTLSLGFGAPNAFLSGVTCLVLLIGVVFGRPLLCLPSLLLTVCELVGDVSDALVAAGLLLAHLGAVPAALYSAVAIIVIAVELFLWHGVLMFYETGIMDRIRNCAVRPSLQASAAQTPSRGPSGQVNTITTSPSQ